MHDLVNEQVHMPLFFKLIWGFAIQLYSFDVTPNEKKLIPWWYAAEKSERKSSKTGKRLRKKTNAPPQKQLGSRRLI